MAAKTTSCFASVKEALLLHTRNAKLLITPLLFLLLAVIAYYASLAQVVSIQPVTDDNMPRASHLVEIKNTGPFSAGYARLLNEIKHDVMKVVVVNIALQVVTPAFSFVKQIVAFFMASPVYFADRYSLAGIIRKVVKVTSLKGPSITIALVTLLVVLFSAVMRRRLVCFPSRVSSSSSRS